MADSRETLLTKAFVCGHPIKHSRSPIIHRYWLDQHQILGSYNAIDVTPDDFRDFVEDVRNGGAGMAGGNVTIPHKERAFALADETDPLAEELGAVNTLYKEDGKLKAINTDGYGFLANLDARSAGWDSSRLRAVVLGAGGASRAIIQALRERGFKEVHVLNRTRSRAQELADRFGSRIVAGSLEELTERLVDADLFVNTTSLGMEDGESLAIDFTPMRPDALVTDIVYSPLITPCLAAARSQGFRICDGLGMLLHQAAPGFEKWFGVRPQVTDELRNLVIADLEMRR